MATEVAAAAVATEVAATTSLEEAVATKVDIKVAIKRSPMAAVMVVVEADKAAMMKSQKMIRIREDSTASLSSLQQEELLSLS